MKLQRYTTRIHEDSRTFWRVLICCTGGLMIAGMCSAQNELADEHATISVGGGLTTITGNNAGKLDHGGNFEVGGGYFFNSYVGVTGNFMFNQLGITGKELALLNQPDGNARVYSLTIDPTVRFPLGGRVSVYFLAGGGYLRRTVEFTQPTLAQTIVFDPWWGFLGPALVPVNQVLGSVTSNSGAVDVGGGINFPMPRTRLKLFMEARYFHGFTSKTSTSIVPIVFGLRW
jgi:hypothetical protein